MFVKSLPNMLTVSNLFLGIVAIILAFQGNQYVEYAAITVIIGMLMDGLDGRVARMLNAQSEFGKELDSLSDVITFGVAPAFIMYVVALQDLNLIGIFRQPFSRSAVLCDWPVLTYKQVCQAILSGCRLRLQAGCWLRLRCTIMCLM